MTETSLIGQVTDWLVDQSLGEPDIVELFEGVCVRLHAIGVPVSRGMLMWSTLHPLFQAENVLWKRDQKAELGQFPHQDQSTEQWQRSAMRHMLQNNISVLRRRLTGPGAFLDFEILKDLAGEGYTDYLVMASELFARSIFSNNAPRRGMFVTWASDRPGGFSDDDLAALQRIQRRLAIACKTVIQSRISNNIAEAYLGRQTGKRVLAGSIRLGDGEQTRALVWYSDLRNSTRLAETMPSPDFLNLLNVYFECSARPAIAAGGEVLAFVGDAVLAIFPIDSDAELPALTRKVTDALNKSLVLTDEINRERVANGAEPIRYGIGLNVGEVMYGNIGVPERLAFSAIGPTVIEVARIEKLTKSLGARVLATQEVAAIEPNLWRSVGPHRLEGLGQPQELFGLHEEAAREAAKASLAA
jgi:adenylate cyclase